MPTLDNVRTQRLERWCQTPETHLPGPEAAGDLIDRVGVATLFAASPEIPNLFHAYVGNPNEKADAEWDSPAGQVFGWRWELGRPERAFYAVLVRNRPTWISWELLPSILRLRGELRMPDELYDLGELSENAYRIARALEESDGALSTGELREAAGFPTGKENRAAYLKAIDELDRRLLVAKVFSPNVHDMSHALVRVRYRGYADAADTVSREEALDRFLRAYLPSAVYALPTVLAKHLGLAEEELRGGLMRLVEYGTAEATAIEGVKGACYVWRPS
ncbi:MAG TPA: hypothetical protein VKX16_18155 [Chloroflexota bacterium]|nr:hypothetical protein [Chloroflexota bacterium]